MIREEEEEEAEYCCYLTDRHTYISTTIRRHAVSLEDKNKVIRQFLLFRKKTPHQRLIIMIY
uniref:Uncharacterized protein n=1 Tax=Arion vulgaris TaxID=1028688 RepID=A0A0B7AHY9_9EUPU